MGLTEDKYESIESDWESQQQIREELNDKPDELRRFMVEKKIGLWLVLISIVFDVLSKCYPQKSVSKQANPLRTTQFELLLNPSLFKSRYPINKAVNQRLKITN